MPPRNPECVFGLRQPALWEDSLVVVPAVYREWLSPARPPAWLVYQAVVYLYQRLNASAPCFALNSAFESGVFLRFIVDHYNHLPAHAAFLQADWFAMRKAQPFPYTPFDLWQLGCVRRATRPHAWTHWLPLGLRHTVWPPYQVQRVADFFGTSYTYRMLPICSGAHGLYMESCWREIAHLFSIPVGGGHQSVARINLTFYPAQNFVASRWQLRRHSLQTYEKAMDQFVVRGDCVRPGTALTVWPELRSLASDAQLELMEAMSNRTSARPKNFDKACCTQAADGSSCLACS